MKTTTQTTSRKLTPRQWHDLLRKSEPEFFALTRKYYAALHDFNVAAAAVRRAEWRVPVEYRVSGMWTAIRFQMTDYAGKVIQGHRAAWDRGEGDTPVSRWHVRELERMSREIARRCAAGERKTTANQARIAKARVKANLRAAAIALDVATIDIREYEPKTVAGLREQLSYIRDDQAARFTAQVGLIRIIEADNTVKTRAPASRALARARRKVRALSKQPAQKRAA